jgi:hypothetical protein
MNTSSSTNPYKHRRFPADIISHGVWLYDRFCLSYRDVEKGVADLFMRMPSPGLEVRGLPFTLPLRSHRRACDLPPDLESLGHGLAVYGSR